MSTQEEINRILGEASDEVKKVVSAVFQIEREKLYLSNPQGIAEEIAQAVREVIK